MTALISSFVISRANTALDAPAKLYAAFKSAEFMTALCVLKWRESVSPPSDSFCLPLSVAPPPFIFSLRIIRMTAGSRAKIAETPVISDSLIQRSAFPNSR
jgi:hypothetical protein